jgi:hypothetical protein
MRVFSAFGDCNQPGSICGPVRNDDEFVDVGICSLLVRS